MYKNKTQKYLGKNDLLCDENIKNEEINQLQKKMEYKYNQKEKIFVKKNKIINFIYDKNENLISLGKGSFGEVYLGELNNKKKDKIKKIAIKTLEIYKNSIKKRFCREIMALYNKKHKNIMKYYGYSIDGNKYFIFTEYIKGDNIKDYIDQNNISIEKKISIMEQLISGLKFLHDNNVIHRDILFNNILIKKKKDKDIPKYIDFGFSCEYDKSCQNTYFPLSNKFYIHPKSAIDILTKREKFNYELYFTNDKWALGIILFYLFSKKLWIDINDYENDNEYAIKLSKLIDNGVENSNNLIKGKIDKNLNNIPIEIKNEIFELMKIEKNEKNI